jgi:hypothetical protein
MLVILFDWREDRIKKCRFCLLGIPIVVALALALAAIPFYGISATMCYVVEYEHVFLTIPISIVMFFATIIMGMICVHVYSRELRVRRWIPAGSETGERQPSLSRKVFWQGFWYLMCFYVSWPIILVIVSVDSGYYVRYGLQCTAMFVAPLQGFLNSIAYSRLQFLQCVKQHACRARKGNECHSTSGTVDHELNEETAAASSATAVHATESTTETRADLASNGNHHTEEQ